jgi:hypothetical protein
MPTFTYKKGHPMAKNFLQRGTKCLMTQFGWGFKLTGRNENKVKRKE